MKITNPKWTDEKLRRFLAKYYGYALDSYDHYGREMLRDLMVLSWRRGFLAGKEYARKKAEAYDRCA
jgi:hypothetical protein